LMEVGHLSDSELRRTMRSVDVVVVPSLYEGFGLPVAEALAEGTSVACSNCTSLPEVAGPCGELFAPRDPVSAASAIIRCLHKDAKFGQDARDQRVAQANQFTWRKHLESLFVGYERVVNK
nr:glycosyltransferase [Myxococcales bacterium]